MVEREAVFETDVPARLDRLPWSRFHWLVIIALGIAWVLDGLEVTIVGSLSGALTESPVLHLTAEQVGLAASAYLVGAVAGALFFGWLTDRLGRKKLFTITVLVYLTSTIACGLSWDFWSFALFRMLTGAGIGGEYAAVNATIQELIPARRRGFTDLVVNGSFWLGAAAGAIGALVVLNPAVMPAEYGWRFAFIIGGVLGLIVLLLRRFLPESPRWLMTHGQPEEAVRVVTEIEQRVERETGRPLPPVPHQALRLRRDVQSWFVPAARALFTDYRRRTVLGVALMAAQAFCYNAVFFTYALILKQFYAVPSSDIGWFMLPFAAGNFLGPLVLGKLFDTLGRRLMITVTYALSGILMALTGWLFALGCAGRDAADAGMDGDLLRRLGRGKLRLSDGRRELPAGDARDRHRVVLRVRHRRGRRRRALAVRRADRHRRAHVHPVGLSARRRTDGGRGGGGRIPRGAGGAAGAGGHRARPCPPPRDSAIVAVSAAGDGADRGS